jgi:ribosomal protein S18 acetylase RimI-like enzyme
MAELDVNLRFADQNDAKRLHKNLFPGKTQEQVRRDLLSDLEQMKRGAMIRVVGEDKGEPIANVQIYYKKQHPLFDHRAEMHTVHVSSEYRRKGIAAAMIKYALTEAKRDGVAIVTVWVDGDNTPALNLYHKCGFSEFGRLDRGIRRTDRFSDYILLKKDL